MVIILLLVRCGVTFCVYRNLDINVEKYDVAIIDSTDVLFLHSRTGISGSHMSQVFYES